MNHRRASVIWTAASLVSVLLYVFISGNIAILFGAVLAAIYSAEHSIRADIEREGFRRFAKRISDKTEGANL